MSPKNKIILRIIALTLAGITGLTILIAIILSDHHEVEEASDSTGNANVSCKYVSMISFFLFSKIDINFSNNQFKGKNNYNINNHNKNNNIFTRLVVYVLMFYEYLAYLGQSAIRSAFFSQNIFTYHECLTIFHRLDFSLRLVCLPILEGQSYS